MLRTVMIGGLVVLALALGYSTWSSRQGQAALRQQLVEITAKLKAIEETQPPTTTGTIRGAAYLGHKSKPAAGVEIQLLYAPPQVFGQSREPNSDWVVERSITTDPKGAYRFEGLMPGTYAIMANLFMGDITEVTYGHVQSEPKLVAPGSNFNVPIDVELRAGQVRISLSRPLPAPFELEGGKLRFNMEGEIKQAYSVPLPSGIPLDDRVKWPLKGYSASRTGSVFKLPIYFVPNQGFVHATERFILNRRATTLTEPTPIYPFVTPEQKVRPWLEGHYAVEFHLLVTDSKGRAVTMPTHAIGDYVERGFRPARAFQEFSVEHNKITDITVIVPEDIESWGTKLVEFTETLSQFWSQPQTYIDLSRHLGHGPTAPGALELADLVNRPFVIEVTGPHPPE